MDQPGANGVSCKLPVFLEFNSVFLLRRQKFPSKITTAFILARRSSQVCELLVSVDSPAEDHTITTAHSQQRLKSVGPFSMILSLPQTGNKQTSTRQASIGDLNTRTQQRQTKRLRSRSAHSSQTGPRHRASPKCFRCSL